MKQSRRFAVSRADFRHVRGLVAVSAELRLAVRQGYCCSIASDNQTFWLMKAVTVGAIGAKFVKH